MKTAPWVAGILFFLAIGAGGVEADWLIHADGQRTEVQAFELGERSVTTVTLNGKPWSVVIDAIDVPATRAANRMRPDEHLSPSWPHPSAPSVMETVEIEPEPPLSLPPPPPPQQPSASVPPPAPTARQPSRARRPPPPPRVTRPPTPLPEPAGSPVTSASTTRPTRVALFVNGIAGSTGVHFGEASTFERFGEIGSLDTRYEETTRPGYELGALVRIKGPFGLAASAELFEPPSTAHFRTVVPHPYFYDRPRELAGERSNLFRRELALHLDPVVTFELGSRVDVDLFSGVSLFFTEADVIDEILYDEVFPFETLAAGGTTLRRIEDRPIGFNVGTSVTLRIASFFGVDFGVRYSRAETRLRLDDERELTFDAGGLRMSAGLRFLFP